MTLLPFTEEAEWLRFVPCLVACKLENGSALVEQTPATTENILRIRLPKKYLANSANYRRRAGRRPEISGRVWHIGTHFCRPRAACWGQAGPPGLLRGHASCR